MKKISDSYTEQVQIVLPEHTNGYGRLFGGTLISWIDIVASVVARRHSGCNVTTVTVDNLVFKAPAHLNDTILLCGQLVSVGNTSMQVKVETFVEKLSGSRTLINTAYLKMVALDKDEKPTKVPGLLVP